MFQRRTRRFNRRPNGRNHMLRGNGSTQVRPRTNSFANDQMRNKFRTHQSAEKLLEKYTSLAQEAISSGDKTLSENFLQHADHFMRIIEDRNRNRNQNKVNTTDNSIKNDKNFPDSSKIDQDNETSKKD